MKGLTRHGRKKKWEGERDGGDTHRGIKGQKEREMRQRGGLKDMGETGSERERERLGNTLGE